MRRYSVIINNSLIGECSDFSYERKTDTIEHTDCFYNTYEVPISAIEKLEVAVYNINNDIYNLSLMEVVDIVLLSMDEQLRYTTKGYIDNFTINSDQKRIINLSIILTDSFTIIGQETKIDVKEALNTTVEELIKKTIDNQWIIKICNTMKNQMLEEIKFNYKTDDLNTEDEYDDLNDPILLEEENKQPIMKKDLKRTIIL